MRFLIKTIILLCCPLFCWGQVDKDSLMSIWNDSSIEDTSRIQAIHQYSSKYLSDDPDSLLFYVNLAFDFAKRKNLKKEMAFTLYTKGIAFKHLGQLNKTEEYLFRSINLYKEIRDTLGTTKSLNALGNVFLQQSNYVKAIKYYRTSFFLQKELGNKKGMAASQNNIGLVFYDLKDFEKSQEYLNAALKTYKEIGDENGEGNTLINIGSIFRHKKEYKAALEYYENGLNLKKKNDIQHGVSICLSNIGLIYQALGDHEKAMIFFNESLELNQKNGNKKEIANCLMYIGDIQKDSRIPLTFQAYEIAKETENFAELAKASEILSKEYEIKGNYKKSLEFYKISQMTKDSIYGLKTQNAILKNEFEYQEQTNNLKEKLKHEKQLQKTKIRQQIERFILFGFLGSTLAYFFFFNKKKKQKAIQNQENLNSKIESLKEKLATQSTIVVEKRKDLTLDKEKIERVIDSKLGESSWEILNILFQDPAISNKEIANKVSLSLEGVSSSLRRMYNSFDIKSSNKKIALIMKAIRISIED